MKPARPTLPAARIDADIGDSREFLELLAQILAHMGHSPKKMDEQFHEICSGLPEPTRAWNPSHLSFLTALPGVIAHWHTDEQFLNSAGLPVPLPLKGKASLTSLIARVLPDEDPAVVVEFLIKFQGISREGHRC